MIILITRLRIDIQIAHIGPINRRIIGVTIRRRILVITRIARNLRLIHQRPRSRDIDRRNQLNDIGLTRIDRIHRTNDVGQTPIPIVNPTIHIIDRQHQTGWKRLGNLKRTRPDIALVTHSYRKHHLSTRNNRLRRHQQLDQRQVINRNNHRRRGGRSHKRRGGRSHRRRRSRSHRRRRSRSHRRRRGRRSRRRRRR